MDSRILLKNELDYLRSEEISIQGTVEHGSEYCYKYHYLNSYFWKHTPNSEGIFYNWESIPINGNKIEILKDNLSNYDFKYDANTFYSDYFFADCNRVNGKLWHMGMVNWDTIQPGKKVIILLHPQYWD